MQSKNDLILDVNEKPSISKWIVLAIQHVFAMFGATILVPILVNSQAGAQVLTIPVALVSSGIGTLIYILCTKGKSPVYLGSSFAFIAPLVAAYLKGGISRSNDRSYGRRVSLCSLCNSCKTDREKLDKQIITTSSNRTDDNDYRVRIGSICN